jgi:hypothetical protein
VLRVAALASLLACAAAGGACVAACSRSAARESTPVIRLSTSGTGSAYVEVVGISDSTLDRLADARYSAQEWSSVLRVSVDAASPPVLGRYEVIDQALRFTPLFPFDRGRTYQVRFDRSRVDGESGARAHTDSASPLTATVGLPSSNSVPTTVVAHVYPSGDVLPENQLRMYIEFSAPMGRRGGIEYVALLDERGVEVEGPFLPLDYEFWNADRTRFTVFFDPGRVKKGILPNTQMGRALKVGKTYTLLVRAEWQDANGLPLKESYRRMFRVGPPDTHPLDTAQWRIDAPKAGGQMPLVVTFPEPVDHGLLFRALGVRRGGQTVDGDVSVEVSETRWSFTPHDAWRAGDYDLLALSILEDRAGNQIGRAFEVDNFETVDKGPDPRTVMLPFRVQ